jgi:signal transduction histidine kinase
VGAPIPDLARKYAEYERPSGVARIRIGGYLAMAVLPLGTIVDVFMYQGLGLTRLFLIRVAGSLAMLPLLGLVHTRWGSRYHRVFGVILAMIPASTMVWVIHETKLSTSPYYAGLDLVLLAVGFVLQWTMWQSLAAVTMVLLMYAGLGIYTGIPAGQGGVYFNNFYFLFLTGLIVVVGNTVTSQLRWREFQLRAELDQNQAELEATNQRLRELDQLKGRFFANISHELRTPLTLLLVPLERLSSRPENQADPQSRDLLATMHANGMRLLKLINDLLDLVRLDAGKMSLKLTNLDVHIFFSGLLHSVRAVAEEKGIRVESDIEPALDHVDADTDKFEKVFLNLLFNAIKFTAAGGRITLRGRIDGNDAIFEVVDTGVGIPEGQLAYVFERFWQGDSSPQRKYQGAGIGLALVRELVQAHGGRVEVRSKPGEGTTMSIRMPRTNAAAKTSASAAPLQLATPVPALGAKTENSRDSAHETQSDMERSDGILGSLYRRAELFPGIAPLRESLRPIPQFGGPKKPKILLADDEPDMLRFLRQQLSDDYEVIDAVDGDQALSLARQYLPEAIVCDMMMPEKDGVQVCQALRGDPSTRSIPFLMLTARADDETKVQALTAGANDFLTKPFSSAELRVRLKNLVDSSNLQRTILWQNRKLEAALEQIKETETQLVQSEKLASLGRLSAGIIHEINNPLNYSRTALYVLRQKTPELPEASQADFVDTLNDIEDGLKRVTTIVSDLRGFTHQQGGTVGEVEVRKVVDRMIRLFAAEIAPPLKVEVEVPDDLTVVAEPNRLLQVLLNLFQNSLDSTKCKTGADYQPVIRVYSDTTNGVVRLVVRDNGTGISEADMDKIFEPFFTTKDVGSGTGLGLSICYRIMDEFGGRIRVDSRQGEYAEFSLEFPKTQC